jgi:carotenoid cleavage dioxygenase-like enzyme
MVFHYVNAWEEINEKGEEIIKLYGCTQTKIDIDFEEEHPFLAGKQAPKLSRFIFNLTTGEADWKILINDISMEFPVIDQNLIGYKNKFAYIALFRSKLPETKVGQDNVFFEGVIKFDLEKEQIIGRIDFGETKSAGEIFFHKRDGSDPSVEEDNGYLMSFVYDWTTEKSEFVMWDAKTMSSKPVMRA